MVATLALVVSVPLQLAAAAGVDLSGGYDSTVLNQRTGEYGDGAVTRLGLDLQLGHQGDTVRQLLRTRGEYYYSSGEGRDFDQGDLVSLTRYALNWQPDDDWQLRGEASYSIGQSSYLLGRSGAIDLNFQRGIYGEYNGGLTLQRAFGERWRLAANGGVRGRHAVDLPPGLTRQNMLTFFGNVEATHDLTLRDSGLVGARTEYFLVDGFINWVARLTGYLGWRRTWGDDAVATSLLVGVDSLEDQLDTSKWLVGPYVSAGLTWRLPDQGLALGASFRYEYALVSGIRCGVVVSGDGVCPAGSIVSGGTGRVLGSALQIVFRPERGDLIFTGDLTFDRGTTENTDPRVRPMEGAAIPTREVVNLNASAIATLRYMFTPQLSVFARYSFLHTNFDTEGQLIAPGAITEINRHVVMGGLVFALGTGDGPVEPLTPFDEVQALHGAASASGGAGASGSTSTSSVPSDDDSTLDPFALAEPDDPRAAMSDPDSGRAMRVDPRQYHPRDPRAHPARPRTATQPLTRPSTRDPSAPPGSETGPLTSPDVHSGQSDSGGDGQATGESNP